MRVWLVVILASVLGCSKPEPPRADPAALAPAPAPAPAGASASASPSASGSASLSACGDKGQPDCPLQSWMKKVANPPMLDKDAPAVADALEKMVAMAPAGYTNWASIAKDGARAARAGDLEAARASCRGCHDQYKKKYRAELRTRSL